MAIMNAKSFLRKKIIIIIKKKKRVLSCCAISVRDVLTNRFRTYRSVLTRKTNYGKRDCGRATGLLVEFQDASPSAEE